MKLKAQLVPYSGVVGGGLMLVDEAGKTRFILAILGTAGITKEESGLISRHIANLIESRPICLDDRKEG